MELLTSDEIVRLSPSERIALIAQLWESLEEHQLPLTWRSRKNLTVA
jgi:putative addiction module component (TIGR02574 family)